MRLTIEKLTFGPGALAHNEDGRTVFVAGGVPGDTVETSIYEEKKQVAFASIEKILEKGPNHVSTPCPYVGRCGGCPWGNVSQELQREAKVQNVRDALLRTAKLDEDVVDNALLPLVPLEKFWGYRNKIELSPDPTSTRFALGMRALNPSEFIPLASCHLLPKAYQTLPKKITGALSYALGANIPGRMSSDNPSTHINRVGIRASERTGSLEIALWGSPGSLSRNRVASILSEATGATSIVRCLTKGSSKERRVIKVEVLSGKGFWEEKIDERRMRFSAPSFAQANTAGANKLIRFVRESLKEGRPSVDQSSHETIKAASHRFTNKASGDAFDLYAGAGTFTLPLAEHFASVWAVESSGFAVRDLRRNVESAHLGNITIHGGDAAREFPRLPSGEAPDVILTDPPRAGLDKHVVEAISAAGADTFIYVSCDIQTLARDIRRILTTRAWNLLYVQPFEMFGQTYHTETIAIFTKSR